MLVLSIQVIDMDSQILDALLRIEEQLAPLSSFMSSVADKWFPVTVSVLFGLCVISLVKWLVKL